LAAKERREHKDENEIEKYGMSAESRHCDI